MTSFLLIFSCIIFLMLALLHIYWALGGKWGSLYAVPTDGNDQPLFRPGPFATLVVAGGLLLFSGIDLYTCGWLTPPPDLKFIRWAVLGIALIFLLRAVGDFRYVGFMKSNRKTPFAYWDTRFYSPLCLLLSLTHWLAFFELV